MYTKTTVGAAVQGPDKFDLAPNACAVHVAASSCSTIFIGTDKILFARKGARALVYGDSAAAWSLPTWLRHNQCGHVDWGTLAASACVSLAGGGRACARVGQLPVCG